MPYRYRDAQKLIGEKWLGSHDCVALVQHYAGAPTTMHWKEGGKVSAATDLPAGTAIATFQKGRYQNRSTGYHAAFFLRAERTGIWIVEQYRNIKDGLIRKRFVSYKGGKGSPSNDGDAYSVIE